MKKGMLIVFACLSIGGCANLKFQWSASYATDNLAADLAQARRPSPATQADAQP